MSADACSTRAPSFLKVPTACAQIAATSGSTATRPPRSGVHARRQFRTDGRRTAAPKARASTSYDEGARSSGPAMTESIRAVSATVRAIGPSTEYESQPRTSG